MINQENCYRLQAVTVLSLTYQIHSIP